LAGTSEFSVVVYAAKNTAKVGFAKKGLKGTLKISPPNISFPHFGGGAEIMVVEINEISEIKKDSIGWFEIGMKDDERYKFCALTAKNICAAPVEPIVDALTAALSGVAPREEPRASEAAGEPPTPHRFVAIPAPDGRPLTLEQTMRFLQEQLGALSSVRYAFYLHSMTNSWPDSALINDTEEVTNVRASAVGCRIDHHFRMADENKVYQDTDESTSLTAVGDVVVMTAEQLIRTKVREAAQAAIWTDPPVFFVVYLNYRFPMYDEVMAHRIADALGHAIEFCRNGPLPQSSTSVGFPASTSNYAPLGPGLSSPSQSGTPQDDKAFSEALSAVFSSASDRFANGRLRQRDFAQDRTVTIWETSLRFPGTSRACQVWVNPRQTYMNCPIRESFYPQPDSRSRFEEVLRALIRILPDNWSVATSGLFGLDQLNRPPDPGAILITVLFAVPTHPEQAFRVTFTPSMGSIDLFMGDVSFCAGCSTMKGIAELRTSLGMDAPALR
jgi:hypothetical protein